MPDSFCLEAEETTTQTPSCVQGWIGDGYCDDINNNVGCNFDSGDCCGANVNQIIAMNAYALKNEG